MTKRFLETYFNIYVAISYRYLQVTRSTVQEVLSLKKLAPNRLSTLPEYPFLVFLHVTFSKLRMLTCLSRRA